MNWEKIYFRSVAILLGIAVAGKIGALVGNAKLLSELDPVFGIPNRELLMGVIVVELGLLIYLRKTTVFLNRLLAVVWLFGCFAIYRTGLFLLDYKKPCSCLGNLGDFAGLTDAALDQALKIAVAAILMAAAALVAARKDAEANGMQVAG